MRITILLIFLAASVALILGDIIFLVSVAFSEYQSLSVKLAWVAGTISFGVIAFVAAIISLALFQESVSRKIDDDR